MRTVRMNDAWNLFRLHRPHGRVEEILCRSGLYNVVCVGLMQYDRALVTTMVERWRPETHCFHLPFGGVTITLQDVQVLFGLRIDGDVVYMQDAARRICPWRTLLETLAGCAIALADMDGASRVWCWERILHVQPSAPPPHDGDVLLPYARRWTREIDRDTESHHVLIPIRDQLDRMTKDQFRTPYNEILHTLPHCCTVDKPLWTACVPMLCLEIVEVHAPDRVMRQFGRPQHVPAIPSWRTNHHVHDQRRRLGPDNHRGYRFDS
ncbi:hypothetical protein KY290_025250 [Solanum tuberosum]|uniref:Aminotransferase-like plant mobile domain-containing protein n=1 Tax=Solanum tuberosum TaxID=4113 RepID=A0ABQ7UT21_SOLTU|nr:hypothetical protein KY284_024057 [Solanum tuberosum]KAH0754980.1 hypothetical protein KY290_025250 [Solanum tuberosum]